MDYFGILRKAWEIAWGQKRLWWFGAITYALLLPAYVVCFIPAFIATGDASGVPGFTALGDQLPLLIGLSAACVLLAVLAMFANYALQASLIVGVNEAAAGRVAEPRECWHAGLPKWGRAVMTNIVAMLPAYAVLLVAAGAVIAALCGLSLEDESGATVVIAVTLAASLAYLVAYVMLLIGGIICQIALCYGVLQDVTFGSALRLAWGDFWGKKGVFVFFLVMLLPGFALSTVLSVIMMVVQIPLSFLMVVTGPVGIVFFAVIMMVLTLVPMPFYLTFYQACWVIFFRRMTGMEEAPARMPAPTPTPADA